MTFPSSEEITEALKNIKDDDFSFVISRDASSVDKTKYDLCKKFVYHLKENNISQSELARKLGIDRSRVNGIIKYNINKFTIDSLYGLWSVIDPEFELKVS